MPRQSDLLLVHVVDSDQQPIPDAQVRVSDASATGRIETRRDPETGAFVLESGVTAGQRLLLAVTAAGWPSERLVVRMHGGVQQVVVGLRAPGELTYVQGDSQLSFVPDHEHYLLVVRGGGAATRVLELVGREQIDAEQLLLGEFGPGSAPDGLASPPDEAAFLVRADPDRARALAEELHAAELTVRLARPIRHGRQRRPFGLTDEVVVSFRENLPRSEVEQVADALSMRVVDTLGAVPHGYLLQFTSGPEYDVLPVIARLDADDRVRWAETNLLVFPEADAYRPNDPLFDDVPHLQLVRADEAWDLLAGLAVELRGGLPEITVGVVDRQSAVSPDHPDLVADLTDGTPKLVSSMNFVARPARPAEVGLLGGDHATQCAGSAVAAFDNERGLPGVAPNCHLLGARCGGAMTSAEIAEMYLWMAGLGSAVSGSPVEPPARSADVISSSWGDNRLDIPNVMREVFETLTTRGRGGRGTVLVWSVGNNGYVDFTQPGWAHRAFAAHGACIAVGASISANPTNPVAASLFPDPDGVDTDLATSPDVRAFYSPFGSTLTRKPDLVAPSSTTRTSRWVDVDPILSCVDVGTGALNGCPAPRACLDYDNTFGGTSHATPMVAGAAALVLSVRPDLRWDQVRDVLCDSAARIDATNGSETGAWQDLDGDGHPDFSRWYGSGRLDVAAAVRRALEL